ncbi:MAG: hypothetical protein LBV08_01375 [Clostridiales bacterium]|jgi:nucleoside 2-deoxyribosyltransferase|nr:hypothetical protein [Clostridiales bacterium]
MANENEKFMVVALCGSMNFIQEMLKLQEILSEDGIITLLPCFSADGQRHKVELSKKEQYGLMHFQRIDMADEILVVDVDKYFGESTRKEIEYAKSKGKPVRYVSDFDSDNFYN